MSATNIFCCQELRLQIAVGGVPAESCAGKTGVWLKYPISSWVWSVGEGVFRPTSSRVTAAARCRLSWKENFKQTREMLLRCSGSVWCIIHVKGSKQQQSWHSSTTCTSHPVRLQCTRICYYRKLNMIIVGVLLWSCWCCGICILLSALSVFSHDRTPSLDLSFGYC